MSNTVLIVCSDLMFSSQLHGAAKLAGLPSRTALSGPQALSLIAEQPYRWVIIDLEMPGIDLAAIQQAASQHADCHVVAYGPHVHGHLFDLARQAGISRVMTRGQIAAGIASLLQQSPGTPS